MAAWDSIKLFYNVPIQFFTVKPDSIRHPVAHVSENILDSADNCAVRLEKQILCLGFETLFPHPRHRYKGMVKKSVISETD